MQYTRNFRCWPRAKAQDFRLKADRCEALVMTATPPSETAPGATLRPLYALIRLAPGSYDVELNGTIVASLVRNGRSDQATWTAELLEDLPAEERPAPFSEAEHKFRSFQEAYAWLGFPEISSAAEGS